MRSEVQEILDKEWPTTTSPRGHVNFGAFKLYVALARLARYSIDIGDDELYEDVLTEAKKITDPHHDGNDKPSYYYNYFGFKSQDHDAIHSNRPRVYIFKEKHGDCIFDASTPEAASKAVLYMLERRLEDGYLMDDVEDIPNQMDLLKSNEVHETEAGLARSALELARSGKQGCLFIAGKKAFSMLRARSGNEYEYFVIEYLNIAEFDLKKEVPF